MNVSEDITHHSYGPHIHQHNRVPFSDLCILGCLLLHLACSDRHTVDCDRLKEHDNDTNLRRV